MSSWNRLYRPRAVRDLHLRAVRTQLESFMKAGAIPQVLLFAGPKGTGKTSTSRIIGALLNDPNHVPGKPYAEPELVSPLTQRIFDGTSFVVHELDAASNRGIDDIRALKERAQLPPQEGTMAVFILDEAHMLTTEAGNALLKLLEEPPAHAAFILATTELHKIPETIASRSHVIAFQKATADELKEALTSVLEREHIKFEPEQLEEIAQTADGSFRDAIKLAESAIRDGALVLSSAGRAHATSAEIFQLLQFVIAKDALGVVQFFSQLRADDTDPGYFFGQLLHTLHQDLLRAHGALPEAAVLKAPILLFFLKELQGCAASPAGPLPHLAVELKLLELIERSQKQAGGHSPSPAKKPAGPFAQPAPSTSPAESKSAPPAKTTSIAETRFVPTRTAGDGQQLCSRWSQFVDAVAKKNVTIAALLRSAQPVGGREGEATVSVYYTFHKEQLMQAKTIDLIDDCIVETAGGYVAVEFQLDQPPKTAQLQENHITDSLVTVASQVLM